MQYSKIGIVAAMESELSYLREELLCGHTKELFGLKFYEGKLAGKEVVLVQSGVGKVSMAIAATLLLQEFHVNLLINTGIAGALDPKLDVFDAVVATDLVQHDMDVSALGYKKGQIPGLDCFAFEVRQELCANLAKAVTAALEAGHCYKGRIVSGDSFVSEAELRLQLHQDFDATCTEMEGAALAQVAHIAGADFAVLRIISDRADTSTDLDYPSFEAKAARLSAQLCQAMLATL